MSDSKTIFISLIGKGRPQQDRKGYQKTTYFFNEIQDTVHKSFFGSALYEVLNRQEYEIDKWLIFGTNQSSWSELIEILDDQFHDEMTELYDKVYDEEEKGISGELLGEWQKALQRFIPGIRLIIVDPLDYEVYINHMLKEIPDEPGKIVLDITHAFRHMPVVIAFSLMVLKHIKNISDIVVYYGAFELKKDRKNAEEPTPVLRIDFINTLVSYAENLATFNYSGYFPSLLNTLRITDTEKTYFWLEMNRQPRRDLEDISKKLKENMSESNHVAEISRYLNKEIEPLIGATLEKRMIERARFFFAKKQYLKDLILLYEGLILAVGRSQGMRNVLEYQEREKIREYINKNFDTIFDTEEKKRIYSELKNTRHAAVHGTISQETRNYLENEEQFQKLFNDALTLYGYISGDELC